MKHIKQYWTFYLGILLLILVAYELRLFGNKTTIFRSGGAIPGGGAISGGSHAGAAGGSTGTISPVTPGRPIIPVNPNVLPVNNNPVGIWWCGNAFNQGTKGWCVDCHFYGNYTTPGSFEICSSNRQAAHDEAVSKIRATGYAGEIKYTKS